MKKSIKILGLLAFFITAISACKTNDDIVEPTAEIVGFWNVDNECELGYLNNQLIQADTSVYAAEEKIYQFTADGLMIRTYKDISMVKDTAFYTLTDSNITVIQAPYPTTVSIFTITDNKLNVKNTRIDTSPFGIMKSVFEINATKLVR